MRHWVRSLGYYYYSARCERGLIAEAIVILAEWRVCMTVE